MFTERLLCASTWEWEIQAPFHLRENRSEKQAPLPRSCQCQSSARHWGCRVKKTRPLPLGSLHSFHLKIFMYYKILHSFSIFVNDLKACKTAHQSFDQLKEATRSQWTKVLSPKAKIFYMMLGGGDVLSPVRFPFIWLIIKKYPRWTPGVGIPIPTLSMRNLKRWTGGDKVSPLGNGIRMELDARDPQVELRVLCK